MSKAMNGEWHSVETAPKGKPVLIIDRFGEQNVATLSSLMEDGECQWITQNHNWLYGVLYWMPLPPPPNMDIIHG